MNNRVNGVLAVTRSLGDSSMKEFVVGSPYTTETTLGDEDDYLIIACDGVSASLGLLLLWEDGRYSQRMLTFSLFLLGCVFLRL